MSASAAEVVLFRAAADAPASVAALAQRGLAATLAPVVEIHATGAPPPQGPFDFVVATSAKAFAFASPATLAAARGAPLYVVGAKTAAAARRAGLATQAEPAEDVAALIPTLPQGRALYLAGRDRKPELEAALGGRAATLVVYEARARAAWDENEARAVAGAGAALHYSERTAALAAELAGKAGLAAAFRRMPHVCLSRAVAAPLGAFGVTRALWPRRPEQGEMLDALETALAETRALLQGRAGV